MGEQANENRRTELSALLAAERAAKAAAEETERWLQPLRRAAEETVTASSLNRLLRLALEATAAAMGSDAASVLVADENATMLISRASIGLNKDIDLDVRVPVGQGFAGRVLATRAPLVITDMTATTVISPTLRESGLRSLLGVPLLAGSDAVGVMHVGSRDVGHFTEADAEVLEVLAEPIAAAIERVRLFERERSARIDAERAAERLRGLQRLTAALASATSLNEVYDAILEQTRVGLPATEDGASIWMLSDGRLRLVAGNERSKLYPEIPLDPTFPPSSHLGSGRPLFVSTREEMVERWPVLRDEAISAFASFPLRAGDRTLGIMAIAYLRAHEFDEGERTFLTAIAEQAALALERAITREREATEQEERQFLAEASLALSSSPYTSPEQLLQKLADLVVPRLADWSSVHLLEGREFRRVALSTTVDDPDVLARVRARMLEDDGQSLTSRVLHSGRPAILGGPAGEQLDWSKVSSHAVELGISSVMLVPLTLHGHTTGVMVFAVCGDHPGYTAHDLRLALEIAQRTAVAADEATARRRDRELAELLTRALLPARFPALPAVDFAARYVPADAGPVGGDWYDAFALEKGLLALVIGDVSGHGVEAASTMARLRMSLAAYATEGHSPPAIFERLASLLAEPTLATESSLLVTILYAELDLDRRRLMVASAGHLPWVLARGEQAELLTSGGRALVPGMPAELSERTFELESGDTLLFMTDGLVERRDEPIEIGLERVVETARSALGLTLEELCDELLARTSLPGGRRDDCCLLALRLA